MASGTTEVRIVIDADRVRTTSVAGETGIASVNKNSPALATTAVNRMPINRASVDVDVVFD